MNDIKDVVDMIATEANEDHEASRSEVPSASPPGKAKETLRYGLQLIAVPNGIPVWVED